MTHAGIRLFAASLAVLPLSNGPSGPMPPCGTDPSPSYGVAGAEPAFRHWGPQDVARDWKFPACVPWPSKGFASMVTIAGRFRHTGGAEGLMERFAQISRIKGVRYWSKTKGRWQTFIEDAFALSASNKDARRQDFTVPEIRGGAPAYLLQKDNTAGTAIYKLRVYEASSNRVIIGIDNASTVKKFMKTILHVNDAQTLYFFDRESNDVWRAYSIMRISDHASSLATGSPQSAINRAIAYYRYFTGTPTDKDPPAAR
jgi:hypothetical protein